MPLIQLNNGKKIQLYRSDPDYLDHVNVLVNLGLLTSDDAAQYTLPRGQINLNIANGLNADGSAKISPVGGLVKST